MKSLRCRILVVLFFGLISLGQAYPFAVAYAMGQAQCGCNLSGRKCIHGCDLKRSEKTPCHGKEALQHKVQVPTASHEKKISKWVNPSCSRQHSQQVLSFQGDPFIPISYSRFLGPSYIEMNLSLASFYKDIILSCEDPPPKKLV